MDIVGLLATVLWFEAAVGTGFAWSTPEKAYAPTTTDVAPLVVTTMFAVPIGFVRYQKSASLLKKECAFCVRGTPPKVIETTRLLFASTPTTSSRLLPVPALKLGSVIWNGDDDTVPDVVLMPFSAMPVLEVLEVVLVEVLLVVVEDVED